MSTGTALNTKDLPDELNSKQKQIVQYLFETVKEDGEVLYTRSKKIASETGFSPKEVGTNITAAMEHVECITIEKWGETTSTTWQVNLGEPEDN